jgi:DDE superfamily endonuclease
MSDESLPWHGKLSVLTADSVYSQRSFLFDASKHKNLVVIARVRSNRIFYSAPPIQQEEKKRGCPKKFGERFDLALEDTWRPPDETTQVKSTTKKGRQFTVTLNAWHHMLMRGTQKEQMYKCPFTLVRVHVTDDTGCAVWKSMWLIVTGEERERISLTEVYHCYRQRFDIEHMFRFKKQRLLMTNYQTPEVEHEENWLRKRHASRACNYGLQRTYLIIYRDLGNVLTSKTMLKWFLPVPYNAIFNELFQR